MYLVAPPGNLEKSRDFGTLTKAKFGIKLIKKMYLNLYLQILGLSHPHLKKIKSKLSLNNLKFNLISNNLNFKFNFKLFYIILYYLILSYLIVSHLIPY